MVWQQMVTSHYQNQWWPPYSYVTKLCLVNPVGNALVVTLHLMSSPTFMQLWIHWWFVNLMNLPHDLCEKLGDGFTSHFDDLAQDCSNAIALLQSCSKPSICGAVTKFLTLIIAKDNAYYFHQWKRHTVKSDLSLLSVVKQPLAVTYMSTIRLGPFRDNQCVIR